MRELPKAYEPKKYEEDIYKRWEKSGFFNPDVCVKKGVAKKSAPYFSVSLPPPNVTGTLHMGHAAMLAIQDLVSRFHRMKGEKTLWIPGADHAGIATQTKVEKLLLQKYKDPKKDLGREKFLEEVKNFAKKSHDTIINQSKKMGASLDWSREAFTLDESRSLAVRTVFKKMYDDKLIYKGLRIVNWCPRCKSTLADDEVEYKEQTAKLYTFKYSKDFPFTIATTRPETKLGDTGVAVNPSDPRFKDYIDKVFEIKKFVGGPDLEIKIVGDENVDIAFGTGAVGVTPAHSHIDSEIAHKNNLPSIKIIDEDGKITKAGGEKYAGLTVLEAREKIVEFLKKKGLLLKEEDVPNNLSVCYRCETAVEPLPSEQFFIDVNKKFKISASKIKGVEPQSETSLKELMRRAVDGGQIEIIPSRFKDVYFHWIDNLRDWCISRQIWYGHRIPVWYKKIIRQPADKTKKLNLEGNIYVGVNPPKDINNWEQDENTLDTWFSSGLWTFATLGWPKKTPDLKNYHPTILMETGYDILFFWVARMVLMTTYVLGDIPFQKVYLHGLVRDDKGDKMSKSKGNVIDPLDMIEKYGTDATRLSLLLGNTPGNDMRLSEEKIAGFRNFTNKLWNISRFMLLNVKIPKPNIKEPKAKTLADSWILSKLTEVVKTTTTSLEQYNFSLAGEKLKDFTWGDLADWYLEVAKIESAGGEKENKNDILNYILNTILKLWHPFMPFVTETIWKEVYGEGSMLMIEKWPTVAKITEAKTNKAEKSVLSFGKIIELIKQIRSLRADNKIDPAQKLDISVGGKALLPVLKENKEVIQNLSRASSLTLGKEIKKPLNAASAIVGEMDVHVNLSGALDLAKEKERVEKELKELTPYLKGLENKLKNEEFVKNAPPQIVVKEKQKLLEAREKFSKIEKQLAAL